MWYPPPKKTQQHQNTLLECIGTNPGQTLGKLRLLVWPSSFCYFKFCHDLMILPNVQYHPASLRKWPEPEPEHQKDCKLDPDVQGSLERF